ncbi:hypothetical protein VTO42DRAFT_4827 [Malbranchea cinnamomea]
MEKYYPWDWHEVSPLSLHSRKYRDLKDLADHGDQGQYALVQRKGDGRLFIRKTFRKILKDGATPDRWWREVDLIRKLRHDNIQQYEEASLCLIQGEIYLEYCPFGSLSHFKGYMNGSSGKKVPESFAKHIFRGLVGALCYLHCGIHELEHVHDPDLRGIGCEPWVPILHCDITIDSVHLKLYRNEVYPVPKLTNFNFAFRRFPGTDDTPFWAQDAGTDGWVPPEHPTKSQRGDVFQVGAVIQCLCDPNWTRANPEGGLGQDYSDDFQKLVRAAMTKELKDRPDAPEMAQMLLAMEGDTPPEYEVIPDEAFEKIHQHQ